jgi:DNA-binding transcriptional regulator GbsR (MarR family)
VATAGSLPAEAVQRAEATPVRRDEKAVAAFVERLASVLGDAGVPRMPARVFAALLATDSGRLTAAELAGRLQASPAAISGATRYLTHLSLISRQREPGSRRDVFIVHNDLWYEATLHRDQVLSRWELSAREGMRILGEHTRAGARMAEMLAFLEFVQQEMPALLKRWRASKSSRTTAARPQLTSPQTT